MQALILAAGLGTRLRPYTGHTPKALFSINRRPLLATAIEKVQQAGFDGVMVNTHHHHRQIESYIKKSAFDIPVTVFHEETLLGTGGAVRNVAGHWDNAPLLIFNADIVTDIDIASVYRFHQSHDSPVSMVMHDEPVFNSVAVNNDDFVTQFGCDTRTAGSRRVMAFTGIHVIDRRVLDFIPAHGVFHIIDAYRQMLAAGERIKACVVTHHYWQDIGTPERYGKALFDQMAPLAFETAFGEISPHPIERHPLHGDGSDRQWFRLVSGCRSLIMVDHGIRQEPGRQEVDACLRIGHHLRRNGVPVPEIYLSDAFAGVIFMEDMGDEHLQSAVRRCDEAKKRQLYCSVIDQWITMAMEGLIDFDPAWTYQTACYDREVILDKECRYFLEAFVRDFLGWDLTYEYFQDEFESLADTIHGTEIRGFLHRDFQSRNIMVHQGRIRFIDFQGGRLGPIQYDLASLLIDPYAALTEPLQNALLEYASASLKDRYDLSPDDVEAGYRCCAVARNLQILGAFAFLGHRKGKKWFLQYIPQASRRLAANVARAFIPLPKLDAIARKIAGHTAKMFLTG